MKVMHEQARPARPINDDGDNSPGSSLLLLEIIDYLTTSHPSRPCADAPDPRQARDDGAAPRQRHRRGRGGDGCAHDETTRGDALAANADAAARGRAHAVLRIRSPQMRARVAGRVTHLYVCSTAAASDDGSSDSSPSMRGTLWTVNEAAARTARCARAVSDESYYLLTRCVRHVCPARPRALSRGASRRLARG